MTFSKRGASIKEPLGIPKRGFFIGKNMGIVAKIALLGISLVLNATAPTVAIAEPGSAAREPGIEEIAKAISLEAQNPFQATRGYTMIGIMTAYSSSPDETDDTPLIGANNKPVGWGTVATNILPFGTRVRFPKVFGRNEIFIVGDRMNARYNGESRFDVWHPSKSQAKTFGLVITEVEILP